MKWKTFLLCLTVWIMAVMLVRQGITAESRASMPSGMEFSLGDALGGINGIITGTPAIIETDQFRLECDKIEPLGDVFHASTMSERMVKVDMKEQGTKFSCTDWVWSETDKTHTLTGKARIVQKNEKGEETLNISGESVVIEMLSGNEMRIVIKQSSEPGSPQARLKMKDVKTADSGTEE